MGQGCFSPCCGVTQGQNRMSLRQDIFQQKGWTGWLSMKDTSCPQTRRYLRCDEEQALIHHQMGEFKL